MAAMDHDLRLPAPRGQFAIGPPSGRPHRKRGGRQHRRANAAQLPALGPEPVAPHPSAPSRAKQPQRSLQLPKVEKVPFVPIKALEEWRETPTPAASPTPFSGAECQSGTEQEPFSEMQAVRIKVTDALNITSGARPWMKSYKHHVATAVGCPPKVPPSAHAKAVWHRSTAENFSKSGARGPGSKFKVVPSISLSPLPGKKWVNVSPSATQRGGHSDWIAQRKNSPSPDREARRILQRGQPLYRNAVADTRRRIREAIREAFCECSGAQALAELKDVALAAVDGNLPNTSGEAIDSSDANTVEVGAILAERIDEGIRLHLPWVPRDAWLTVITQLIDQESRYVQPQLVMGAAATMGVLERKPIMRRRSVEIVDMNSTAKSRDKFNSNMSTGSNAAFQKCRTKTGPIDDDSPSKHHRQPTGGGDQPNQSIACSNQPPDPKRERRWRNAFCRLVDAGRVRREALPRALELAGFCGARQDVIDSVFGEITKVSSLGAEEYIRFVRYYEQRQQMEVYTAFMEADQDGSGQIDVEELKDVLARFGIEPLRKIIESVVKEVDSDGSQQLSCAEFEKLMTILRTREGFTKDDDDKFTWLFNRFDKDNKGHINTDGLRGALSWLGYSLSQDACDKVARAIDIDGSGTIDYHEFLMCMRKVREREIDFLKGAIRDFDFDKNGMMNIVELEELFRRLGYIPNRDALLETMEDCEFGPELNLDDLWELLQLYRTREGLTRAECVEVEAAFARYDTTESGEISVLDVGKALRWFGYPMSFDDQQYLTSLVDVDKSGKLDVAELRKLIRMYWEEEIRRMQNSFFDRDADNEGEIAMAQAREAYRSLSLTDAQGRTPQIPAEHLSENSTIDVQSFIRLGIQYKKRQREAYRKNGGYSHDEIRGLQQVFQEYDTDHSGNITNDELGCLIKDLFPVMSPDLRLLLDELMREITMNGSGSLDFQDFIRIMRQFHDIQTQEHNNKERQAIEDSGFLQMEVQDFREMFLACDEIGNQELMLSDVKKMLMNICVVGDKQVAELGGHFREASKRFGKIEEHRDRIDFPEFLLLMKKLIDTNFGNIKAQIGWTRVDE